MRLLDQPIRKQAAVSNRDAIARILMGTGIGGVSGLLGELAMTGKLGWKGALAGGVLGTGASVALNPEARQQLVNAVRSRLGGRQGAVAEMPKSTDQQAREAQQAQEPQLTTRQEYDLYKKVLESGQDISPEDRSYIQDFIKGVDDYDARIKFANSLYKDPRYEEIMRHATDDSYLRRFFGQDNDVGLDVIQYADAYQRNTGRKPAPEHLYRFAEATRMGLQPDEWGDYMADKHELSGIEEGGVNTVLPQLGMGVTAGVASRPIYNRLARTPGGMKLLERIAGKGTLSPFVTGVENQGIMRMLFRRKAGQQIGAKLGGKAIGAKVAGKMVPGLNVLFDAPELLIDPRTGKYRWDALKNPSTLHKIVGENIANQDRLMELREQHDTMIGVPGLDWTQGNKRNMLYNIGMGGLRGWFNMATTAGVYGKRKYDLMKEVGDAAAKHGAGGLWNQAKAGVGTLLETGAEMVGSDKRFNYGTSHRAPTMEEINAYRRKMGKQPINIDRRVTR